MILVKKTVNWRYVGFVASRLIILKVSAMFSLHKNLLYRGVSWCRTSSGDEVVYRKVGSKDVKRTCKWKKLWSSCPGAELRKEYKNTKKFSWSHTEGLPVLLYNAETWTMKEELNRKLLVFEMTVLCCIAGVTRRDRRRNTDIRLELGVTRDVVNHIRAKRLSYFGHVARMPSSRIPNIMMYGRVQGRRPVGRPKKRWLDNVREDCHLLDMNMEYADRLARNRVQWRSAVRWLLERIDSSMSQKH